MESHEVGRDPSGPQEKLNALFTLCREFNEAGQRALPASLIQVVRQAGVERDLTESGLTPQEARASFTALEGTAQQQSLDTEKELFGLLLQDAPQQLGVTLSPGYRDHAVPIISDGASFASALAEIPAEALTGQSREDLTTLLKNTMDDMTRWTIIMHKDAVLERHAHALPILEAYVLDYEHEIDASVPELMQQVLAHADEYCAQIERLGMGEHTAQLFRTMAVAAQEGTLPEFALVALMGGFETDEATLSNQFIASWEAAEEWRPLDEVIEFLDAHHPRGALRSHLAQLLPATLDVLIAAYYRTDEPQEMTSLYDEDDFYLDDDPPVSEAQIEAAVAQLRQKRAHYAALPPFQGPHA